MLENDKKLKSVTVQISSNVANRLDHYCDINGRVKAWVVEQSIKYFLENEDDVIDFVKKNQPKPTN